ncbi:MAG: LysM peptidoglycan-binding domain-containing protein [Chloroflexota bacterium]
MLIAAQYLAVIFALTLALSLSVASAAPIDPTDAPAYLGLKSYEVVEGDTLSGLAERFGITAETIIWANDLEDGELLNVGQQLVILPVSGVLHLVQTGESILSIADLYGVEADTITEANQISEPELIREGDILLVPDGVKKVALPATNSAPNGASESIAYRVEPGDTLHAIAAAFGVTTSTILAANNIVNPDYLKIGQELLIPGWQQPQPNNPPAPPAPILAQAPPPPAPDRAHSARGEQEESEKSFIATVTAYCLQGRTRSGTPVKWGVVAVDPNVIPLGSKILIEGFGEIFSAEDTGSGVRGKWVDIWVESCAEARVFGLQSRRVTILEP